MYWESLLIDIPDIINNLCCTVRACWYILDIINNLCWTVTAWYPKHKRWFFALQWGPVDTDIQDFKDNLCCDVRSYPYRLIARISKIIMLYCELLYHGLQTKTINMVPLSEYFMRAWSDLFDIVKIYLLKILKSSWSPILLYKVF